VTARTCTESGYTTHSCTLCGDIKTEKIARLADIGAFMDLIAGNYFHKSVKWAIENELTTGVCKDSFSSSQVCTCAQVVTFLYRAFK